MPLLSVIVPIYNSEHYLHKCIDSILSQSMSDFELILIDDGSVDSSGKICDEYAKKDTRIRVFHKENGGVSSARNLGLDNAQGEWIIFVDSDDWIDDNLLVLLSAQSSEIDLILTSYYKHNKITGEVYKESYPLSKKGTVDEILQNDGNLIIGFFTPWAKFYRRSIIEKYNLRFDILISSGEDTIFNFQYMKYVYFVQTFNIAYYNWIEANGLTYKKSSIENVIYTIEKTVNSIEEIERDKNIKMPKITYNSLLHMLNNIEVKKNSIVSLAGGFRKLFNKEYIFLLAKDRTYINKGKRRKIVDFFILYNCYWLMAIWCKFTKRIYV